MKKAGFATRLVRMGALVAWLFRVMVPFRRLDNATPAERERVLRQAALDGLKAAGVRLEHGDLPRNPTEKGLLVVSNHVSWLDIMAVCALYPCGFIAMKEIQRWPMIGKIVANAGTVFIDRRNRHDIEPINNAIAAALNEGKNVCFYPEARTSLGNNVLPLKAALFQAAINAQAAVQPLALRYYDGGKRTEKASFAAVNLIRSVWQVVSVAEMSVRVDAASPFLAKEIGDRFALKESVESWLRAQVLQDSPNPERTQPESFQAA